MTRERQQGSWGAFFATLALIVLMATWAFVPAKVVEEAWQSEQRQVLAIAGERSDAWIKSQVAGLLADAARAAAQDAGKLGDSGLERWLKGRIYMSVLWLSLIAYRASELLMWMLLGIPLILAASVDGFYVREIRKTAFISQSPIRHKIGVHFFRFVSIATIVMLLMPLPLPIITAPAVVVFFAISLWLWMANLQKRI
ncbi:hypothetical protein Hthe01_18740 [Hydrogenophilus thermoluteolus]|uniref:DUF4400 domain-containing protein n=1 Tax=Hydrogenophilus thermoluteolus TaxID=297 RepID=UPI0024A3B71D|nr:DUF4400 domain-containing protein [Hydrogenophilus thermoluteolus]GLW61525.1 hypothetical protein Hthe01_18740 [Hydrogenophilus thermoluteolus]